VRITLESLPAEGQQQVGEPTVEMKPAEVSRAGEPVVVEVTQMPARPQAAEAAARAPRPPRRARAAALLSGLRAIGAGVAATTGRARSALSTSLARAGGRLLGLDAALFTLSLGVYAAVRLIHLPDFPIYFFTDEAVQTLLASDLVRDHFRDFLGHFFPTFFQNVYQFNLSTSVYAQVLPYLVFGKSVFVTRATSVLLTLPGAAAIGLTLRDVFKARHWWLGVLFLSITPAWFLHSRTAFETAMMVSFYACFLYLYLLYRYRSPLYLYPALILGAIAFYTYAPGQIIVTATGAILLISDLRYHWQNRRVAVRALFLLVLLALPYVRFQIEQPGELARILRLRFSPWTAGGVSMAQRLGSTLANYARGISPSYWFIPNETDLPRHLMRGYGHILVWTLPFALIGVVIALARVRSSAHRAVLACLLAVPLAGAVAGVGITRVLAFVVPVAVLTALAADAVVVWVERRVPRTALALALFAGLAAVNFWMLRDSLVNGPLWYSDYGMGGMAYGGRQVFGAAADILQQEPGTQVLVSPTWANGVDILRRFFIPDDAPVTVANADGFLTDKHDLSDQMLFVLTPEEYAQVLGSPLFTDIRVDRTLPYPDGRTGFYFLRMRYSPHADELFAQRLHQMEQPVTETITIGGESVLVQHPVFDAGRINDVFDGDTYTLARTYEANPAVFVLTFDKPRPITSLSVTTGSMDVGLTVRLFADPQGQPTVYSQNYTDLPPDPTVDMTFKQPPPLVMKVEIDILDLLVDGPTKVHVREIKLGSPGSPG
jgi:4-amino-4-deoxy-L-arabinose transferase-like glycosyltransferase